MLGRKDPPSTQKWTPNMLIFNKISPWTLAVDKQKLNRILIQIQSSLNQRFCAICKSKKIKIIINILHVLLKLMYYRNSIFFVLNFNNQIFSKWSVSFLFDFLRMNKIWLVWILQQWGISLFDTMIHFVCYKLEISLRSIWLNTESG